MSAAAFRLFAFVALAAGCVALWLGFLRTSGGQVGLEPAIPAVASQSIFAPSTTAAPAALARRIAPGLSLSGLVTAAACPGCTLHLGNGGLVRAQAGSGARLRKAYALLDLGSKAGSGSVVAHDVISLGRGQRPLGPVRVAQLLDGMHRVIYEVVAQPDRRLVLVSPAGGLRATPLSLPMGATVPNDGISAVALQIALKPGKSLAVYVNGVRTASVAGLTGATTAPPQFLATGIIQYTAPADAPPLTATHTQVSVSTPSAPAPPPTPAPAPAQATPAATAPAPAPAPIANTAPPTVTGTSVVGSTLTADPGSWTSSSATFAYAWQRCDANGTCGAIDGATDASYKLDAADRGAFVRVRVTATDATGSATKASAAAGPVLPLPPANVTLPTLAGDAIVGSTLTATLGTWDDSTAALVFDWRRCDSSGNCTTIDGANGLTYVLTGDDVGFQIRIRVTATNDGGSTTARSTLTAAVTKPIPVPPSATGAPFVSGSASLGATLTANPGTWTDPAATFAFQWQRCDSSGACSPLAGATSATYTPTADDLGQSLRVEVTATGTNGAAATVDSATVGPVTRPAPSASAAPRITGTPTVGATLTGDGGTWNDSSATFAYQWQRCDATGGSCAAIAGATASTYTPTTDDQGSQIRLEVTATDAAGTGVADSAPVGPVAPPAPTSTAAPSVSGDATVGSTLTAAAGTWSDPAATISYQWQSCDSTGACTPIAGAAGSTYVVAAGDVGNTIRVEVTATNAGGSGVADSAAVGPVAAAPPPATTTTTTTETTTTQTTP
ncbi:MAG: hypothetical protein JO073_06665 [Actinobacteria bacterium]|nr:hypothetical protein [Actinomycetota bacterium]